MFGLATAMTMASPPASVADGLAKEPSRRRPIAHHRAPDAPPRGPVLRLLWRRPPSCLAPAGQFCELPRRRPTASGSSPAGVAGASDARRARERRRTSTVVCRGPASTQMVADGERFREQPQQQQIKMSSLFSSSQVNSLSWVVLLPTGGNSLILSYFLRQGIRVNTFRGLFAPCFYLVLFLLCLSSCTPSIKI